MPWSRWWDSLPWFRMKCAKSKTEEENMGDGLTQLISLNKSHLPSAMSRDSPSYSFFIKEKRLDARYSA
jgi:hypothetical protein